MFSVYILVSYDDYVGVLFDFVGIVQVVYFGFGVGLGFDVLIELSKCDNWNVKFFGESFEFLVYGVKFLVLVLMMVIWIGGDKFEIVDNDQVQWFCLMLELGDGVDLIESQFFFVVNLYIIFGDLVYCGSYVCNRVLVFQCFV